MAKKVPLQITLNGEERAEFIESGSTLLKVLRERLEDTSAKAGCNQAPAVHAQCWSTENCGWPA